MSTPRTSPLSSLPAARPGWRAWLSHRHPVDWLYAAGLAVGALVALWRQGAAMDGYETAILLGTVPALVALAWHWRPLQALTAVAGLLALSAIALYITSSSTDDGGKARASALAGQRWLSR